MVDEMTPTPAPANSELAALLSQPNAYETAAADISGPSRNEAMAQVMWQVLPVVLGLMKGSKGTYAGALGGLTTGKRFQQLADEERKRKQVLMDASIGSKQALKNQMVNSILQSQRDEEKLEASEESKKRLLDYRKSIGMGPKGTNITVKSPLNFKVVEDLANNEIAAVNMQKVVDFIDQNFPEEALTGDLGKMSLRKAASLNPNSAAAALESMLEEAIVLYQEKKIKGNPSDKDVARVEAVLLGKAPISSLKLIRGNLARLRDAAIDGGNIYLKRAQQMQREAGNEEFLSLKSVQEASRPRAKSEVTDDEVDRLIFGEDGTEEDWLDKRTKEIMQGG